MEFLQNLISLPGDEMVHVVSFPGLGLEFTLNRVAIEILGRPIYWYGIIITFGLILAVVLCSRWAPRFGVVPDQIIDLMLFAIPAALVAIRAYYVIFNLSIFQNEDGSLNWGKILNYGDGGLAIYGAIISSAIVLLIFCHVRKLSFMAFADLGVHGLFIGQLIGRWGNFMNVEAYGGPTTLPWRMCSDSIARELLTQGYVDQAGYQAVLSGTLGVHPTFFYESLWNFVGLILVYFMGKKRKFDGQCFLFYVFWYGLGRAWIEPVLFRAGALWRAYPHLPAAGGGVRPGGGGGAAVPDVEGRQPGKALCEPACGTEGGAGGSGPGEHPGGDAGRRAQPGGRNGGRKPDRRDREGGMSCGGGRNGWKGPGGQGEGGGPRPGGADGAQAGTGRGAGGG